MALNTPIGLTPESFNNMITGAGAGYTSLALTAGMSAEEVSTAIQTALESGECLGATRGGFSFDFSYETRDIEADGKTFPFKGSTTLTVMNASVATTLLEVTPGVLSRVFSNSELNEDKNHMRFRMQFTEDSYIPEMWFIMALIGGGYVGIKMQNVLNIEGSSPTTTPDGEMELPGNFRAHQASLTDSQYGPAEVFWFYPAPDEP
ncbi:hypothetical protein LJC49_07140 [Ruminococcaceae bacterium OttesenSCG-928-I18]|nr:hypothetical protein [Ruminococcaceae bacterium OttesenSCG-928-I18]